MATLGFIVVVNFFLFRVINPHPERTLARGRAKTPEQVQAVIEKYGLDKPLPEQFLIYLKNIVTLDFGDSYQYSQPVRELMLDRLWPTVVLVGTSTILSIVIGIWIGTIAAWNRGRTFDQLSTTSTITLYSMPEWWLGLILFFLFSTGFAGMPQLFPIGLLHSSGVDPSSLEGVVDTAWHLILPVVTLTLAYLAEYSLIMRSALLDEMGEDYLQTARAKGLADVLVRRRHAMRNALLPVVTLVVAQPRLHRVGRDHDRDGVLHTRPRIAHDRRPEDPRHTHAARDVLRVLRRRGDRQPGLQPLVRLPRPEGAAVSAADATADGRRDERAPLTARQVTWRRRRASAARTWKEFARHRSGLFGLFMLILFTAVAIFAPLLVDSVRPVAHPGDRVCLSKARRRSTCWAPTSSDAPC